MAEAKGRHVFDYDHYSYTEYGNSPRYRYEVVGKIGEMGMSISLIASMKRAELLHYLRSLRQCRSWYAKRLDVDAEIQQINRQLGGEGYPKRQESAEKLAKRG